MIPGDLVKIQSKHTVETWYIVLVLKQENRPYNKIKLTFIIGQMSGSLNRVYSGKISTIVIDSDFTDSEYEFITLYEATH